MTDHERLGVRPSATREELEAAFRRKKLELHPDIVNGRRRQAGLPPDPQAEVEFRELVAAFERLAAAGNNGEVPAWAKDLIGRWGLVVGAAKRGDIPGALGELQGLAIQVQGQGQEVLATAVHIHDTVKGGIDSAKAIGSGLRGIWDHLRKGKA
jgi:hypothetical protein